jgi:hypothetical protein
VELLVLVLFASASPEPTLADALSWLEEDENEDEFNEDEGF